MKKIIALVALFVSVTALAQEAPRMERMKRMMDTSPEEMAEIQTKRMTLALVLDDKQQKEIYNLELANAKERKAKWEERASKMKEGQKPTDAERKEMMAEHKANRSEMLDKQIAQQEKMQKILNEEQFDQWRKMKMKQHNRMGMRDEKRGDRLGMYKKTEGARK